MSKHSVFDLKAGHRIYDWLGSQHGVHNITVYDNSSRTTVTNLRSLSLGLPISIKSK